MLKDREAIATVAVKSLAEARSFYEDTLGLKADANNGPSVLSLMSGDSKLLLYESQYAGTNQATAVTWVVNNVDVNVETLKTRGVKFEHYDLPGAVREGDLHVSGDMRVAWFKDPDGNILCIVNDPRRED
jgi:catechol 2,3-dioxygenase-like lactoylglutathione lyase family enzyme